MSRESQTEGGASPIVRDFAEGFSLQSKLANRTWIALVTIIIFNIQEATCREGVCKKELAFGFGTVDATNFDTLIYFIISIVTISFCALIVQMFRIYDMAHSRIDDMTDAKIQRPFFDMLTNPTFWRVGPLAIKIGTGGNEYLMKFSRSYYYVLRVSAGLLMLGIPFYGIMSAGSRLLRIPTTPTLFAVKFFGIIMFILVLISMLKAGSVNCKQMAKVGRRIGGN